MARKKQEDAPKGSPAWMNTFSDLMNHNLLFSMSTVDAQKFEQVVASLQSTFSVLPAGGSSIQQGQLISSGVSQLKDFNIFFEQFESEDEEQKAKDEQEEKDVKEAYEEKALEESEEIAEKIEKQTESYGISDQIEVDFNAQYVLLTLNGVMGIVV